MMAESQFTRGERTEEIRSYIFTFMKRTSGRAPTIREIVAGVSPGHESGKSLSTSLIDYHLNQLVKMQVIRRSDDRSKGRARWIEIVGAVYILPPEREAPPNCHVCGKITERTAYDTGDGWLLEARCIDEDCYGHDDPVDIGWPFSEDAWINGDAMEEFGYILVP